MPPARTLSALLLATSEQQADIADWCKPAAKTKIACPLPGVKSLRRSSGRMFASITEASGTRARRFFCSIQRRLHDIMILRNGPGLYRYVNQEAEKVKFMTGRLVGTEATLAYRLCQVLRYYSDKYSKGGRGFKTSPQRRKVPP